MSKSTMDEFIREMQEKERITFTMLKNQTNEIMKSEKLFKDLLVMLARHTASSVSNTILVQAQFPEAVAVTSIPEWEKRQCPVVRDENGYYPQGIYQFEYAGQWQDENGKVRSKFKIYKGYDASQTYDPEAARIYINDRTPVSVFYDDPDTIRNLALCNASPVKCIPYNPKNFIADEEFIDEKDGAKYIPETKTVVIRKLSKSTWFFRVCQQIALGMYHKIDGIEFSNAKRNFEAAIVAFIVSEKIGIDTSCYHFHIDDLSRQYDEKSFRKMLEQTLEYAQEISFRVNARITEKNAPKSPRSAIELQRSDLS